MSSAGLPIRNGVFVAVVGPSGAGKDTLIAYAQRPLRRRARGRVRAPRHHPAERSASEDHDTLADAAFDEAEQAGAFAHVLGGARPALRPARQRRPRPSRTAMWRSPTSRAARLPLLQRALRQRRRGRDHRLGAEILAAAAGGPRPRIARRGAGPAGAQRRARRLGPGAVAIDNSGSREEAGERFVAVLRKAIAVSDVAGRCSAATCVSGRDQVHFGVAEAETSHHRTMIV